MNENNYERGRKKWNNVVEANIGICVEFGDGTLVWQYATVCNGVKTGKNCVIGSCAWIGHDTVMGDDCRIQHGAFIPNKTIIGTAIVGSIKRSCCNWKIC